MKRIIVIPLVMMFFLSLLTLPALANNDQSEAWLINEEGKRTSYKQIETGSNIDIAKVRLREGGNTIGKLEEGDKIALILSNASFIETPLLLEPPANEGNRLGRTGDFSLEKVANTGRTGDNAVLYELKRTNRIDAEHRNLDYVFHLQNIKVEAEGDITLTIIGGAQSEDIEKEIIKPQTIKIAEAYTIIPETVQAVSKTNLFEHERISRELGQVLNERGEYVFENNMFRFEMPRSFFQQGDMSGILNDERWTLKIVGNSVSGMRVANPDFSQEIGVMPKELLIYKKDGFNAFSDRLAEDNFEPFTVVFKDLNPTSLETTTFVPVQYVRQSDGRYQKELAGAGVYNNSNRSFTFTINGPGIYSVEKRDSLNITMRINNRLASVNGMQRQLDVPPQLIDGFAYVPIRFLAESLGAEVRFIEESNQVEVKTNEKTILLPIDQITSELSTPARIIDGRTLVPVRFVSEQLGANVTYFAEERRIEIVQ